MGELTDVQKRRPHFLVTTAGKEDVTPGVFLKELEEVKEENPDRSFSEREVGNALKTQIESTGDFWVETGVNLWELARDVVGKGKDSVEILKKFKHPSNRILMFFTVQS